MKGRKKPGAALNDGPGLFRYSFRISIWAAMWIASQAPPKGGA